MKTCADYIAAAKAALGNPRMSDRELGERVGKGYANSTINMASRGRMTDPLAMDIAAVVGCHPGEVLMVARLEREKDESVRAALAEWAVKTFGLLPVVRAHDAVAAGPDAPMLAGLDVAMPTRKQNAPMVSHGGVSIGGEGRFRSTRPQTWRGAPTGRVEPEKRSFSRSTVVQKRGAMARFLAPLF